ncbi:DHHC zinc finger domain protein [Sporothrix schenckii 1099-18]|uniref:Palmitoyltransferase n=1 Tax=Sporothrix schenckii 1099-18 TaxID=1397361 RepID=A0A0F2MAX0_SPOSC|nr:DHHC zinc finger domain protein [Sporothrix schenckii 1099-18]KJR85316.1 DHHC zinc finger domain protein [Sporothrix schenckii 1099-18]
MGVIAKMAGIVLAISLLTFIIFFGRLPIFRRTPIAWLYTFFVANLPGGVLAVDRAVTGGRFTSSLKRFGHFMMNDKHPTVLIFFLVLLAGSEWMAIPSAWAFMGTVQRMAVVVSSALPYVFLYLAAYTDPGTVSMGSLKHHLSLYPYDYGLFHPGARCYTCNLLKPPRSKHCPVCKRCIGRLDHHCIFINNCVGVGNHHWFLLLLLSTAFLASYGGWMGLCILRDRVVERFPSWSMLPWRAYEMSGGALANTPLATRPMSMETWLMLLSWGMKNYIQLGSVSLLGLLISPLVWGLLAYNLWNVWTGQTTNESLKWSDMKCDMEDGLVYKRRLDVAATVSASASSSRWPLVPEHVFVLCEDGNPPPPNEKDLPGVGDWERVWTLRDAENLYDLGFWSNLKDIFIPNYQFNTKDLPAAERRGRPRRRVPRK